MKKILTITFLTGILMLVGYSSVDTGDMIISSEIVDIFDIYWSTEYDANYIIADGWAIETQELENTAKMRSADQIEIFYDEYDNITGYEFQ